MWSDFVLKANEVKWSYVEVFKDKSNMHIKVTVYWGYLIVLLLFYLACILYCVFVLTCFVIFEYVYVWVLYCVGVLTIVWMFC